MVLIDAMSVLHRAFHAYPTTMATPKGEVTNAIYGFLSILFNVLEKVEPTYVSVAWDVKGGTFRHEFFAEYKGKREKPDELLIGQIERTKQAIDALNIPQYGVESFEADDLIGTLSEMAKVEDDLQVVIVTGDRDALQLVDGEKVIVWMPASSSRFAKDRGPMIYDQYAVEAKYHIRPDQVIELKALQGDASDNIPGVRGVGPKTAEKLLADMNDLENIYKTIESDEERVKSLVGPRILDLLKNQKEMAFLSKRLATIKRDVPIIFDLEACRLSDYNKEKVIALFDELNFKTLRNKLPKDHFEESVEEMFA